MSSRFKVLKISFNRGGTRVPLADFTVNDLLTVASGAPSGRTSPDMTSWLPSALGGLAVGLVITLSSLVNSEAREATYEKASFYQPVVDPNHY